MGQPRTQRERVVVLGQTKLGEKDLIVTLLAEDGRRVRAVAKGARRPGSRLAAPMELFSEADALLARGRNLDIVTEASLVRSHRRLGETLESMAAASAVVELARDTCYEDAEDPYLAPILRRTLDALEEASDQGALETVVAAYGLKTMAHGGWRPELERCVACGDGSVTWFSPQAGGALCEGCARDVEGAYPVDPAVLQGASWLLGTTFDRILAQPVDPSMARQLLALSHGWASAQLERGLRAWDFLRSL